MGLAFYHHNLVLARSLSDHAWWKIVTSLWLCLWHSYYQIDRIETNPRTLAPNASKF